MKYPNESWAGIKRRATAGEADCQYLYGCALLGQDGHGTIDEARKWLELAIRQGHADAMYELARSIIVGDPDKAMQLLTRAGEMGSKCAQSELGDRYRTGDGVTKDIAKAIVWYKLAGLEPESDSHSSRWVGEFYASGLGVEQDWEQAAHWYKTAADSFYQRYQKALTSDRKVRVWDD